MIGVREKLDKLAQDRILILDGAMGTMIQSFKLTEEDFRGSRFASYTGKLLGCNDILCLTRPDIIERIHRAYLEAGADIIETCSFNNSNAISLADYGLAGLAYEISVAAAAVARKAADAFSTSGKPRFVAGSMGPTAKSASIPPDMNDLSKRAVTFDELAAAYYDSARGLLDGGADILLIETIFDTLNAKAAIFAVDRLREERQADIPLMLSATIADDSGRILSGQSAAAFCASVLHGNPWALGLNCSFGAASLEQHVRELAGIAPCLVSVHPNAGLPNRQGEYDENPETMAASLEDYMRQGLVNIVGGCCGSSPAHIAAISEKAGQYPPRRAPAKTTATVLAGLKPLCIEPSQTLIFGGEEAHAVEIPEDDFEEAAAVARDLLEDGAAMINVCWDNAADAKTAMIRFLSLGLCYSVFASVPVMVESRRWEVIEAALKYLQGKSLVNSLSLKDGEMELLRKARLVRRYGAVPVIALTDEQGPAASYEQKISLASRCYVLLTGNGFSAEDFVIDICGLQYDDFNRAYSRIRVHSSGVVISRDITAPFPGVQNTARKTLTAVSLNS
jgi:5-methyltetrahydrofolate--homocysteine methyltransferase